MVSIGSQFSTGEQSQSIREAFWHTRSCQNPACPGETTSPGLSTGRNTTTITSRDVVAGCRFNGDAYGTTVFTCTACGWHTSFQYDEADDECYYYETKGWTRPHPNPSHSHPSPPRNPWATIQIRQWMNQHNFDEPTQETLRAFALDGPALAPMGQRHLRALGLSQAQAVTVAAAIAETNRKLGIDAER